MMNDLCTSCFAGHLEASEFQQTLLVCTTCGFVTEALEVLEQQEYQAGLAPLREQSQGRQRDAASVVPVHRLRKVGVREVGDSVKDWVVMTRGCLSEGAARIGRVLLRGGNDDDDDEVDDDDDDDDDVDEGADERLGAIAEDIWWRLVAHSAVLEEAAWEGVVEEIARTDKERNQDSRHVVFERFLRNRVGFDTVYAILFVGCLIERYPIDVFDVSTLFMSTGALRPDRAAQTEVIERNLASREFLRRDGVPSPVRLYLDARQLVSQLGIVLPPLNVHAWLARFDGGDGHDGGCDVRAQVGTRTRPATCDLRFCTTCTPCSPIVISFIPGDGRAVLFQPPAGQRTAFWPDAVVGVSERQRVRPRQVCTRIREGLRWWRPVAAAGRQLRAPADWSCAATEIHGLVRGANQRLAPVGRDRGR